MEINKNEIIQLAKKYVKDDIEYLKANNLPKEELKDYFSNEKNFYNNEFIKEHLTCSNLKDKDTEEAMDLFLKTFREEANRLLK